MNVLETLEQNGILLKEPPKELNPQEIIEEYNSIPHFQPEQLAADYYPFCRHKDVCAYEKNRYRSPHNPLFWIDASVHPTGFIATMGPLDGTDFQGAADTRPHFWQMVEETGCNVIVMLTDLYEGDRLKCSQYWPQTQEQYGPHTVTHIKSEREGNVQLRHLEVNGRTVHHLHLLHWADNRALPHLLDIERALRQTRLLQKEGPIIAHCSAGVGRTGSFIACYCIQLACENGFYVDLKKLIGFLRQEGRARSVEQLEQYQMLHAFRRSLQKIQP